MLRYQRSRLFTAIRSAHSAAAAPLNVSRRAVKAHLQMNLDHSSHPSQALHDVKGTLHSARKLRDSALVREIVNRCVRDNKLTKDTFVLALECYKNVGDAQAALQLYKQTTEQFPVLKTTAALSVLLNVLSRASASLSEQGIGIYKAALKDSSFSGLGVDQRATLAALGLYLNTKTTNADLLNDAVRMKTSLQEAGVALNPAIYTKLINIAGKMGDYGMCKSLYQESQAAGMTNIVANEAALLTAALQNGAHDDCLAIYTRLQAQGSHAVNSEVVAQMLGLCVRTGQQALGLNVLTQWHSAGGALTWPICLVALDLFLTPALMATLSSSPVTATEWTVVPASATITWKMKERRAYQKQLTEMPAVVVDAVLRQVLQSLKSFQHRSAYEQSQQLGPASLSMKDPTQLPAVPIDILTRLGALIATQGSLDLVLARLEAPMTSGVGVRLQQHQRVIYSLAQDLAELGRWRELISLSKRLMSYSSPQDSLYYSASATMQLHASTLVCLLRAGQQSRALDLVRSHILPFLTSNTTTAPSQSKLEPFAVLVQALEQAGACGLSNELAFMAQQGVAVLEPAQAQTVATAVLMQCSTVSDVLLCLTSLHAGAVGESPAATAGAAPGSAHRVNASQVSGGAAAAPGERFRLSERHLDAINSVLCNASTAEDKVSAAKCGELVEALRTHEPML